MVLLIGALQGWILAALLAFNKPAIINIVIGAVIAVVGLALFIAYMQLSFPLAEHTYLIKAGLPLSLLFVPGLYLYIRLLTGKDQVLKMLHLTFFIPFLISLVYNLPFYLSEPSVKLEYFDRSEIQGLISLPEKIEDLMLNLVALTFAALSFSVALDYRKRVLGSFSELDRANTKWVLILSVAMLTLTSTAVLILLLQFAMEGQLSATVNFITAMGATVLVYFISFYSLKHPHAFRHVRSELIKVEAPRSLLRPEKTNSGPSSEEMAQEIKVLIEKKELFRNPQLTLSELAKSSRIPEHILSKIINGTSDTNFYTLVNSYRLADVKSRLTSGQDKGIMESAYASGFNSKSAFYEAFKKDCGMSPSAFIASHT